MKNHVINQSYLIIGMVFLISLLIFTAGLNAQEVTSFDTRFYLFAKEMLRNGMGWFPTTYGEPYPDYPVTSTLLIYVSATMFGGLNKLTAVLPSAMAAACTVALTYLVGALQNRKWGLIAASFMLMTLMFLKSARAISLDMYPALFTAWCFYLVYKADLRQSEVTKCIYLLLALSFAFRGPIGLVMPAGVISSYYLLNRNWKKLIYFGTAALMVLVICTAVLFVIAYYVGGHPFLQDVIRMQFAGRIENTYQPLYFYFTNSIGNYAVSYPLAWLVILGMIGAHRKQDKKNLDLIIKLAGWMLVILIGMSIPGDKKARYILPMVPAIALIAAYPFAQKIKMRGMVILFAATFLLDAIYIVKVEPYFIAHEGAKEFVTQVEMLRAKTNAALVFYRENPDGTPIKYQIYNQRGDTPVFIKDEQQLLSYELPAVFITSEDFFSQLSLTAFKQFKIVMRGRLGHVQMVVFKRSE